MDARRLFDWNALKSALFGIRRIGVIYATSSMSAIGREMEKVADSEIIRVAHAIKDALDGYGYSVDLIDLDPDHIGELTKYDWIFNLVETIYGFPLTEYEVAQELEKWGIPFTGSGSAALRSCLDKAVTKAALRKHGILTPAYNVFLSTRDRLVNCRFPVIVKPIREDGSIGITKDSVAWNQDQLALLVERVIKMYNQPALVEEYIDGRDITASVIGTGMDAQILPLKEVTYSTCCGPKFLTFKAKWMEESSEYQEAGAHCPCSLKHKVERKIIETAYHACKILDVRDYARVDFRLHGSMPYVLEVNPNPCINPDDSGYFISWQASGRSYDEMILKILESSIKAHYRVPEFEMMHPEESTFSLIG